MKSTAPFSKNHVINDSSNLLFLLKNVGMYFCRFMYYFYGAVVNFIKTTPTKWSFAYYFLIFGLETPFFALFE